MTPAEPVIIEARRNVRGLVGNSLGPKYLPLEPYRVQRRWSILFWGHGRRRILKMGYWVEAVESGVGSGPIAAVEGAVLDGLCDVGDGDGGGGF